MAKTRRVYPGLKARWMELPAECFRILTFGELKVDQKFICLPIPGDNSGHGGFRGAHYLFTKTRDRVLNAAPGLPYGIHHGQARNMSRGILDDFPDSMNVILVE